MYKVCILWAKRLTMQIACKENVNSVYTMIIVLDINQKRRMKVYLKVKSKKLKNLSIKISQVKNNLVVNILNKKGYECNNSQISQIKANRKLNSEQKKVILENRNEKVSKIGSYYVWEADVIVKIVDKATGKEV